jgi:hypothetical protein
MRNLSGPDLNAVGNDCVAFQSKALNPEYPATGPKPVSAGIGIGDVIGG